MRILTFLLLAVVAGCELPDTTTTAPSEPNYGLLGKCDRPGQPGLAGIYEESLCGTISVWEDREARTGRRIDLNVMLIKARTPNPVADPIVFLAGGPGQAATDIGPVLFSRFDELRRKREVLLVDQRGTGNSNPLFCAIEEEGLDPLATMDDIARVQIETMRECLESWDANPALYTTPIAMDDLNEVRERLGYDRLNLYGISYGTRAALVYMRRHEDSVRSAILDGVVPMTMSIPEQIAVDAQSAFDRMLDDCAASEDCAAAFPDLEADFVGLMTRLKKSPEQIKIENPRTGTPIDALLEAPMVTRLVRAIIYDRDLTALMPLALTQAAKGNYRPLATLSFAFSGGQTQGELMSLGMMTSVLCAEDMTVARGPFDTEYFDNAIYHNMKPLCEFWPSGSVGPDYFEPVSSDVPVLLVSGLLDPVTPPKYAFQASETLPNSRHVLVPGVGHGVTYHGCMPDVMAEFIEDLDPAGLDAGCIADFKRPPFFTSFSGSAPLPQEAIDD